VPAQATEAPRATHLLLSCCCCCCPGTLLLILLVLLRLDSAKLRGLAALRWRGCGARAPKEAGGQQPAAVGLNVLGVHGGAQACDQQLLQLVHCRP
jgi:hypothetical protein